MELESLSFSLRCNETTAEDPEARLARTVGLRPAELAALLEATMAAPEWWIRIFFNILSLLFASLIILWYLGGVDRA